jgi:hypothetical protein
MGYEIFTKMTRMATVPKLTIAKKPWTPAIQFFSG